MKVTYDPEVDVLRILFRNAPIEESDEDKPGVILDYDKDGNVVVWKCSMLPKGSKTHGHWGHDYCPREAFMFYRSPESAGRAQRV